MTDWGSEMAAIAALCVTALAGIGEPVDLTTELGWRPEDRLETGELPLLFVFEPKSTERPLDFAQAEVTSTYRGELWADVAHATMATWRAAIVTACALDPQLGSSVKRFRLTTSQMVESQPGATGDRRVLVFEWSTLTWEG